MALRATMIAVAAAKSIKSLSPERQEAFRTFAKAYVAKYYKGVETHLARALGMSQPQFSAILKGESGPGMKAIEKMADLAGVPIDVVIGRASSPMVLDVDPKDENRERAIAVAFARPLRSERAIEEVLAFDATATGDRFEWLRRIETFQTLVDQGRLPGRQIDDASANHTDRSTKQK